MTQFPKMVRKYVIISLSSYYEFVIHPNQDFEVNFIEYIVLQATFLKVEICMDSIASSFLCLRKPSTGISVPSPPIATNLYIIYSSENF